MGMVKFHDAMKVAKVPFPFPYAQTTVTLLMIHWVLTPLVMVQWTKYGSTAAVFTFVQVLILWSLNAIATGIEHPFGGEDNDIDPYIMQKKMNEGLLLLVNPKAVLLPKLAHGTKAEYSTLLRTFRSERFYDQSEVLEPELCTKSVLLHVPLDEEMPQGKTHVDSEPKKCISFVCPDLPLPGAVPLDAPDIAIIRDDLTNSSNSSTAKCSFEIQSPWQCPSAIIQTDKSGLRDHTTTVGVSVLPPLVLCENIQETCSDTFAKRQQEPSSFTLPEQLQHKVPSGCHQSVIPGPLDASEAVAAMVAAKSATEATQDATASASAAIVLVQSLLEHSPKRHPTLRIPGLSSSLSIGQINPCFPTVPPCHGNTTDLGVERVCSYRIDGSDSCSHRDGPEFLDFEVPVDSAENEICTTG